MQRVWRTIVVLFAFAVATTVAVLPASAGAATPERGSKTNRTVARRDEGGLAEAMSLVEKVTVAGDRAVITYRAAGEKRPRRLEVDYSKAFSSVAGSGNGASLYWLTMLLACMGLAVRLVRLKEARVPELARRRLPPADR